ncbi:putative carboxylesterase 15 [Dorcoceras hygrometricum]|uniref:Putative carboxylesterase 15 n=1 Tax=Dorcoceras hygrometricum TaxID=472368 RepID=A0A2Z7DA05_9LAMI|nr:putative carboxylesterase 15 [Dorcoceras hygrometricum]
MVQGYSYPWAHNHCGSGITIPDLPIGSWKERLATSSHDPLGITDSACKNQLVVVSVQYGPFNPYIPIRSTTIGKSRVAKDPIAMHTSWRSNSDITSATSIGYPRMSASGESSTTMHRLLHASGSHPIPPPNDPKSGHQSRSKSEIFAGDLWPRSSLLVLVLAIFPEFSSWGRDITVLP